MSRIPTAKKVSVFVKDTKKTEAAKKKGTSSGIGSATSGIPTLGELMKDTNPANALIGGQRRVYTMVMYVDSISNCKVLPYVPPETVQLAESQSTVSFDSPNASYSTPGAVQPLTLKWSGVLPKTRKKWCNTAYDPDPVGFRKWLREHRQKFRVFTVIITTEQNKTLLNSRYTITKASFTPRQNGDFDCELEFEFCKKIKKG